MGKNVKLSFVLHVVLMKESNTVLQLAYKVDVFTSRHDSVSNSGVVVER